MVNNIAFNVPKEKIVQIKAEIESAYSNDQTPWVIAYSGGKDSTMTVQITLETIMKKPRKEIHILYADTRVEPPPVINSAKTFLKKIKNWARENNLPVRIKILYPELKDSFFVLMLGKGYLPPTRYFRWCTERLKVKPIKNYIRELIKKQGGCVVLLGMRLKESANRDKGLTKRGNSKWMPFEGIKGAMIYAPILELSIEDVWSYLLENEPPWGADNSYLRTLYTGGNTSCSLFCGGIRFGCWVCTVVKKDKCTEGLSQIPGWEWLENLLKYRDLMLEVRDEPQNRMWRQNNGQRYLGPLNLKARKLLYRELKKLENKLGQKILSSEEERMIHNLWKDEKRKKSI
jgi:DNA sulfur modification protein DndC